LQQTAQYKIETSSDKKTESNMDFSKLTNPNAKSAIEALQANEFNA